MELWKGKKDEQDTLLYSIMCGHKETQSTEKKSSSLIQTNKSVLEVMVGCRETHLQLSQYMFRSLRWGTCVVLVCIPWKHDDSGMHAQEDSQDTTRGRDALGRV